VNYATHKQRIDKWDSTPRAGNSDYSGGNGGNSGVSDQIDTGIERRFS
jgi:hypothetical protein